MIIPEHCKGRPSSCFTCPYHDCILPINAARVPNEFGNLAHKVGKGYGGGNYKVMSAISTMTIRA